MSSSSSTDYSRKDSRSHVTEVERGCTTSYVSSNNADDSVQPYEGEPLANEEWMSHHTKERIAEEERLEILRRQLERSETVDNWYETVITFLFCLECINSLAEPLVSEDPGGNRNHWINIRPSKIHGYVLSNQLTLK